MEEHHIPVLLQQSIEYLITVTDGNYFDGTLGFGGHTSGFLGKLSRDARLIATEVDLDAYEHCKKKFKDEHRLKIYRANFRQIDIIEKIESLGKFNGIFADLGVSSFQLDNPEAGFTYRQDSILDLRLDKSKALSAADVINDFSETELSDIFFKYGEEKNSRKIARRIVEKRQQKKISTTTELADVIGEITPQHFLNKVLSRVFQSLRIYVNDELGALKEFLYKSVELLAPEGRIVVLTYHSLEDKIVKEIFKNESLECVCPPSFPVCRCNKEKRLDLLTRKPIQPTEVEISSNRRARSARLRAAKRVYKDKQGLNSTIQNNVE